LVFMIWSDNLSVGVDQIDIQHKRLVEILNTLHEAMLRGSQKQDLERVMMDLLSYTRYHFSFEEKLMVVAAYPDLAAHQRKHQAMVAQVSGYAQQVAEGRALVSIKLLDFLKQWLSQHIQETDRQFGEFEVARKAA
jgi:hemerythrin